METGEKKKKKGLKITAIVLASVVFFCVVLALAAEIATRITDRWRPWKPNYGALSQAEMNALLAKDELTAEDYATLYAQTGLTKLGIDGLLAEGNKRQILRIQSDYFADYKCTAERFAPYTCWEKIDGFVGLCALEPGDIIVTDATHVVCWRFGHAGLVLSASGDMAESFGIGTVSAVSDASVFQDYASFMVLRPKVSAEKKAEITAYARKNLIGLPYRVAAGVLSKKNPKKAKGTQCAHLVWYAYKKFGIDLDSNGGGVVKPQDMANSPYVEVVQVYGFDPERLWR
ncbi:MAG: hypothetical protein IJY62_00945 [Clostridia bacterium]|nr:hypothetical protein [Clostridia bacterium]